MFLLVQNARKTDLVNARLVALVDRNDKLHSTLTIVPAPTCQLDHLLGLRHNTIICSNNKHNNVRHISPTRPHRRKRSMSRCIQERNRARRTRGRICTRLKRDRKSTNVLSDAPCFSSCD